MLTDPIADMLTRIRNGSSSRKERVDIPWSKMKERIAAVMVAEGFLKDMLVVGEGTTRQLRVGLCYDEQRRPVITGIVRGSRPSLRRYFGAKDMPRVRGGLGVNLVSTPKGVLADHEARRQNVGGELVCSIW